MGFATRAQPELFPYDLLRVSSRDVSGPGPNPPPLIGKNAPVLLLLQHDTVKVCTNRPGSLQDGPLFRAGSKRLRPRASLTSVNFPCCLFDSPSKCRERHEQSCQIAGCACTTSLVATKFSPDYSSRLFGCNKKEGKA